MRNQSTCGCGVLAKVACASRTEWSPRVVWEGEKGASWRGGGASCPFLRTHQRSLPARNRPERRRSDQLLQQFFGKRIPKSGCYGPIGGKLWKQSAEKISDEGTGRAELTIAHCARGNRLFEPIRQHGYECKIQGLDYSMPPRRNISVARATRGFGPLFGSRRRGRSSESELFWYAVQNLDRSRNSFPYVYYVRTTAVVGVVGPC